MAELRQRDEAVRDLSLAWHVATFGISAYVGKLPDLDVLVRRLRAGSRSSGELHLEAALIAEQIGVPMRPMSDAAKRALLKLSKES